MDMQPTDLNAQAIAEFLTRHPNFFNDFPTLLADLHIPHPHGTHAVSMSERQLIAMRDKVRMLENKLAELIQFGEENDGISDKLHALTLALLAARAPQDVLAALNLHLREGFAVPHHAVRVWNLPADAAPGLTDPVSDAARAGIESMGQPVCGPLAVDDASVPVENSLALFEALRARKVPVEMHLFEEGGHGFGIRYAVGLPAAAWPDLALGWMQRHGDRGEPPQ